MVPDVLKKTMVIATQHFPPGEILLMSPAASFGTQRTVASGWHALQESLAGHKRITLRPPKPASFNASLFICPSPIARCFIQTYHGYHLPRLPMNIKSFNPLPRVKYMDIVKQPKQF